MNLSLVSEELYSSLVGRSSIENITNSTMLPAAAPPLNMTELRDILSKLSQDEISLLLDELRSEHGHSSELDWLLGTYEESLMGFQAYRIHKMLMLYLPPILIILGTFGNIFSFIILKRKAMLKFSTYFYLMVLAVADTLVLYIGLLVIWVGELTGVDIRERADWVCKLTNVIGYTASDFSVWLIIAVTIERYIVVCHPLKANTMCNTPQARKVIVALLLVVFLVNSHMFWTLKIEYFPFYNDEPVPVCTISRQYAVLEKVQPFVDAFIYSFLPFIVITILNSLIIRQVVHARRNRNELRSGSMYEQRRPSHEGSTRLTVMLLTISFAFLITTLPMSVVHILVLSYNGSDMKRSRSMVAQYYLARTVTELLMYVNHSMNFFLYCATGQKFRHQLVWMVCYAKRTYNLTFLSEGQSFATRFESVRNIKPLRSDGTELHLCSLNNLHKACTDVKDRNT